MPIPDGYRSPEGTKRNTMSDYGQQIGELTGTVKMLVDTMKLDREAVNKKLGDISSEVSNLSNRIADYQRLHEEDNQVMESKIHGRYAELGRAFEGHKEAQHQTNLELKTRIRDLADWQKAHDSAEEILQQEAKEAAEAKKKSWWRESMVDVLKGGFKFVIILVGLWMVWGVVNFALKVGAIQIPDDLQATIQGTTNGSN